MTTARREGFKTIALGVLAVFFFSGFLGLGTWQVYRLQYKLDLIERVDSRIHKAPTAAPGPEVWDKINRAEHEYLRVFVSGRFDFDKTVKTLAVTELGSGYWWLTPLHTTKGTTVWVNRGFVPLEQDKTLPLDSHTPQGVVDITGLLRLSEPKGGFLRDNQPHENRWYSRDIHAMSSSKGVFAAPYFIDQQTPAPSGYPRANMTVVQFSNNHLVYALTWYALALMTAWLGRRGWQSLKNPQTKN